MRVVFIGSGEIGLPTLEALLENHQVLGVVTQPDKAAGRRMELRPPPVKVLATQRLVPVFQPVRIRDAQAVAQIAYLRPEVIVVMAYGQILPDAVLQIPGAACLNLHASLLPKHRGASPVHAAVLNGDTESGISVMHMTKALDAGDVVLMKTLKLGRRERTGQLHDRLAALAPDAILEALEMIRRGDAPRTPQDDSSATFCPKLSSASGHIDWSAGRCAVDRQIRGMAPWPGAFTMAAWPDGLKKWKIGSAYPVRRVSAPPGRIVRADFRGIVVGTGDGALLVRELQPEGKRWMRAEDFLRGNPLPQGLHLR